MNEDASDSGWVRVLDGSNTADDLDALIADQLAVALDALWRQLVVDPDYSHADRLRAMELARPVLLQHLRTSLTEVWQRLRLEADESRSTVH